MFLHRAGTKTSHTVAKGFCLQSANDVRTLDLQAAVEFLQTCKTIRKEATPLLYKEKTLVIYGGESVAPLSQARHFQFELITSLSISVYLWEMGNETPKDLERLNQAGSRVADVVARMKSLIDVKLRVLSRTYSEHNVRDKKVVKDRLRLIVIAIRLASQVTYEGDLELGIDLERAKCPYYVPSHIVKEIVEELQAEFV